jgi:cytosine/adenosine deaminase-related metal-dependent hydrolase
MAEIVRLTGARVALDAIRTESIGLKIDSGRILPFDSRVETDTEIDLTGYLLLPGLINAHDHLEFNLFPRLGKGPYPNASEWARDIYHPDQSPIREHLSAPKPVRLIWGGIKNLLSGVTTVAHHNPYARRVFTDRFPVKVLRRFGWAHSLDFSPDIEDLWKRTPEHWPFIVHAAEGTDEHARGEISRLAEMGMLSPRTVLVHAVAMNTTELDAVLRAGCGVVWCPASNLFSLGRTLCPDVLRSGIPIALATDSALTAQGDMIDEIRVAMDISGLNATEIYPLVTTAPARMLRLSGGQGRICEGGAADLVAVKDTGQTPAEAVASLKPELVMVRGRVMLVSSRFRTVGKGFHAIHVEGRGSWMIRVDVPRFYTAAAKALGPEIRVAGRRVCP